ncbi:uncharacterized protein METZ01_LOCUS516959, partial [marine metagenome]
MTDNEPQSADQQEGEPLGLNRPGRLELKKTVESGQVRQSFSHGRTKTVQVEKKKKRTFQRSQTGSMTEVVQSKADESLLEGMKGITKSGSEEEPLVRHLTVEEKAARARAVEGALKAEHETKDEVDPGFAQEQVLTDLSTETFGETSGNPAPSTEEPMLVDEAVPSGKAGAFVET